MAQRPVVFSANVIAAAGFSAGSATAAPVFTFTNPKTAPLTLVLRASDGEVSSSGFTEGQAPIRSGRLRLLNADGSELLDLPVSLEAQIGQAIITLQIQLTIAPLFLLPASS